MLSCYLAGSFTPWRQFGDWRDFVAEQLKSVIKFYDPRIETKQGSIATFVYQDLAGVESCDCTFYFLTRAQGDVGAASECAHANAKGKHVILCIDRDLDFVHPFIIGMARRVLIGLDSGVSYLSLLSNYGMDNEYKAAYEMLHKPPKEKK